MVETQGVQSEGEFITQCDLKCMQLLRQTVMTHIIVLHTAGGEDCLQQVDRDLWTLSSRQMVQSAPAFYPRHLDEEPQGVSGELV